ncbi:MAG TPA: DNA sulfur modification protein DndB [Candidatus Acidoferrales bacterium]|nr:DNA sulfur modification protein DndB [Candidatus Acidoferrales bacterium]
MQTIVKVPAIRGRMGGRTYFTVSMKLKTVPRFFEFQNYKALEPDERAQRVINKLRIPAIRDYLLENPDGYVFSSITASYQLPNGVHEEDLFTPFEDGSDIGVLNLPMEADLLINDGQHRRAGIAAALEADPSIGEDSISVVLFPFENHDRAQQMFSDLNRTAQPTTKSLNILYDHRDRLANITMTLVSSVGALEGRVDKEHASLSRRSPALITLGSLHDGTKELLGEVTEENFTDKVDLAIAFWQTVAAAIPAWSDVAAGQATGPQVREATISTHAVTLRAIGTAGRGLIAQCPDTWASTINDVFASIDWSRQNPEWDGVVVSEGDVLNRRQNQRDLTELLRVKLGIATAEERLRRLVHEISNNRPQLALTARLRAADTRPGALDEVTKLEQDAGIRAGAAEELRRLLEQVYLEAA